MNAMLMNYIFHLALLNICLVFSPAMAKIVTFELWVKNHHTIERIEELWDEIWQDSSHSRRPPQTEREGCMANTANVETKRQHWRHKVKLLVRDSMGWWGSAGEEEVGRHGDDGWGEGWLPIYISCHISSAFTVLVLVPLNETSIVVVVSLYLSILVMTLLLLAKCSQIHLIQVSFTNWEFCGICFLFLYINGMETLSNHIGMGQLKPKVVWIWTKVL